MAKTYARFGNSSVDKQGTVVEVIFDPCIISGISFPMSQCYTAEFISWLLEAPDGTVVGDSYDAASNIWTKAAP